MDWQMDEFPEDQVRPAGNAPARENVEEGRHRFEIVRASEDGPKLKLGLAKLDDAGQPDKGFGWVWCNPPRDKDFGKQLVASLARALGLGPAAWNATKVADLEGRQVEAEIYHKQDRDRLWVNVEKFIEPSAAAIPEPVKPVRRPAAAQQLQTDDIPF